MPAALPIGDDWSPAELRRRARRERDGRVSARLVALANALDGLPREEAARLAGMTGQTLRDWVLRYNAEGLGARADRPRPGRRCALDEGQRATLKALILRGPDPKREGCREWRIADLRRIAHERFGVAYAETGMLRADQEPEPVLAEGPPPAPESRPYGAGPLQKGPLRPADGGGRPAPPGERVEPWF